MKKRTMDLIKGELKMLEDLRISLYTDQEPFDKIMLVDARISQTKSIIHLINLSESENSNHVNTGLVEMREKLETR